MSKTRSLLPSEPTYSGPAGSTNPVAEPVFDPGRLLYRRRVVPKLVIPCDATSTRWRIDIGWRKSLQLLDHVSIGVPDLEVARPFYDAIMNVLGAPKVYDRHDALGYGERCSSDDTQSTCLAVYLDPVPVSQSRRHWCFKAVSREQVDAFFLAGLSAGGCADGEPGVRSRYHECYFAAFLFDPAGNRVEAVCHARPLPPSIGHTADAG